MILEMSENLKLHITIHVIATHIDMCFCRLYKESNYVEVSNSRRLARTHRATYWFEEDGTNCQHRCGPLIISMLVTRHL